MVSGIFNLLRGIPCLALVATILTLSVQQQVCGLGHLANTVRTSSNVLQTDHVNVMEGVPDRTAQEEVDAGVQDITIESVCVCINDKIKIFKNVPSSSFGCH